MFDGEIGLEIVWSARVLNYAAADDVTVRTSAQFHELLRDLLPTGDPRTLPVCIAVTFDCCLNVSTFRN